MANEQLIFEIGAIMLVSFIGAALATKAKQSVIIGYILAGIFIGPFIHFELFGLTYDGLVHDTAFIAGLSTLGLTLLMFFVGLGFSMSKLKRSKSPAIIVALINTGLDMFFGIMIGYALGWPIVDTVFLAGVFAMGSAAITGKSLMEMQRMSAPETEFLLGIVVVEDFVSMVIMTIAGGLIFKSGASDAMGITEIVVGVLVFYAFFIFLALVVIPRVGKNLQKIRSDELFVLFALGLLFLSAAMAEVAGVPAIIGAFFLGMIFSETKITERLEDRIEPFKDAFVAVFFVSFGMLIDPSMFSMVLPIVLLAIPLVILSDLILTGALAYFLGFSARGATFMSSSMCGRGAESVMFASVGANSYGVTKANIINPFAGLFCFVMSVMTPVLMKVSDKTAAVFGRIIPGFAKYGGSLINRSMGKIMLPSSLRLFQRTRRMEVALVGYFVLLVGTMVTTSLNQLYLLIGALSLSCYLFILAEGDLRNVVKTTNYSNLGVVTRDPRHISRFIAGFIFATLLAIVLATFLFTYLWWLSMVVLTVYLFAVMMMMHHVHHVTKDPTQNLHVKPERHHSKEKHTGHRIKKSRKTNAAFASITPVPRSEVQLPEMELGEHEGPVPDEAEIDEIEEPEDEGPKDKWGRL